MASYVPVVKNGASGAIFYVSLVSQANTKIMQVNPTIASGDFKVSIDGGALANLGTLPAVTPAGSTMVKITLAQAEVNGDNITVVCLDAAGAEWCDLTVNLQTATRQIDNLAYPATSGRSMVVDASGLVDATTVKIGPSGSGTAQTARDVGASVLLSAGSGTGQLDFTSGVVKANATQWLGGTIPAVNVTGVPLVDLKYTLGTLSPATAGAVRADSVTGAVGSVTGAVGSVTGAVGSVTGAVGSVTGNVGGNVVGTVASVSGAVGSVVGLTASNLDTTVSSRLASASYTAPPTAAQNATATLTTQMTESYAANGVAPTLAEGVFAVHQMLQDFSISGTAYTVKKLDNATTAFVATLNDATSPTAISRS